MLARVGPIVVAPHLQADLDGLFQALESFGGRRKRHAETVVLAVVPGGADAELGTTAGDDADL